MSDRRSRSRHPNSCRIQVLSESENGESGDLSPHGVTSTPGHSSASQPGSQSGHNSHRGQGVSFPDMNETSILASSGSDVDMVEICDLGGGQREIIQIPRELVGTITRLAARTATPASSHQGTLPPEMSREQFREMRDARMRERLPQILRDGTVQDLDGTNLGSVDIGRPVRLRDGSHVTRNLEGDFYLHLPGQPTHPGTGSLLLAAPRPSRPIPHVTGSPPPLPHPQRRVINPNAPPQVSSSSSSSAASRPVQGGTFASDHSKRPMHPGNQDYYPHDPNQFQYSNGAAPGSTPTSWAHPNSYNQSYGSEPSGFLPLLASTPVEPKSFQWSPSSEAGSRPNLYSHTPTPYPFPQAPAGTYIVPNQPTPSHPSNFSSHHPPDHNGSSSQSRPGTHVSPSMMPSHYDYSSTYSNMPQSGASTPGPSVSAQPYVYPSSNHPSSGYPSSSGYSHPSSGQSHPSASGYPSSQTTGHPSSAYSHAGNYASPESQRQGGFNGGLANSSTPSAYYQRLPFNDSQAPSDYAESSPSHHGPSTTASERASESLYPDEPPSPRSMSTPAFVHESRSGTGNPHKSKSTPFPSGAGSGGSDSTLEGSIGSPTSRRTYPPPQYGPSPPQPVSPFNPPVLLQPRYCLHYCPHQMVFNRPPYGLLACVPNQGQCPSHSGQGVQGNPNDTLNISSIHSSALGSSSETQPSHQSGHPSGYPSHLQENPSTPSICPSGHHRASEHPGSSGIGHPNYSGQNQPPHSSHLPSGHSGQPQHFSNQPREDPSSQSVCPSGHHRASEHPGALRNGMASQSRHPTDSYGPQQSSSHRPEISSHQPGSIYAHPGQPGSSVHHPPSMCPSGHHRASEHPGVSRAAQISSSYPSSHPSHTGDPDDVSMGGSSHSSSIASSQASSSASEYPSQSGQRSSSMDPNKSNSSSKSSVSQQPSQSSAASSMSQSQSGSQCPQSNASSISGVSQQSSVASTMVQGSCPQEQHLERICSEWVKANLPTVLKNLMTQGQMEDILRSYYCPSHVKGAEPMSHVSAQYPVGRSAHLQEQSFSAQHHSNSGQAVQSSHHSGPSGHNGSSLYGPGITETSYNQPSDYSSSSVSGYHQSSASGHHQSSTHPQNSSSARGTSSYQQSSTVHQSGFSRPSSGISGNPSGQPGSKSNYSHDQSSVSASASSRPTSSVQGSASSVQSSMAPSSTQNSASTSTFSSIHPQSVHSSIAYDGSSSAPSHISTTTSASATISEPLSIVQSTTTASAPPSANVSERSSHTSMASNASERPSLLESETGTLIDHPIGSNHFSESSFIPESSSQTIPPSE